MICTPKVRQTFGGAYFYEKERNKEQKILARIQNICYTRYARTSFGYREVTRKYDLSWHRAQSWERIYLEEGIDGLMKDKRGRKSKSEPRKKPIDKQVEEDLIAENQRLRMEIEYLKKLSALVLAEERKNGKRR